MSLRPALLPDPAGLFGLVSFLVLAGSSGAKALRDGDTLWHIRFGELMLERGALITRDTFSHTAYGQPWLAHEWLSEIIMALAHGWAGLSGVALFYFAIVSLTFTLLFRTASRLAGDGAALAAMAVSLPFAMTHLLARPHLFTWLGAALTLLLLERGGRALWWLIPVTAIWANLHGGVLFGLAIQLIFILGRHLDDRETAQLPQWSCLWKEQRPAVSIFLLSLAATCLNPFGYQLFLFPFKVASPVFAREINEWKAPDFQLMWYLRLWIVAFFMAAAWTGRHFDWRWRLLALFLLWQTLAHVRHASLMVMLLVPMMAVIFQTLRGELLRGRWRPHRPISQLELSPWTGPLLTAACCVSAIVLAASFPSHWQASAANRFPLPETYSQGVVDYLKKGHPEGNLLNHYEWGDYLIYALADPPRVFIDGRADMYGERIFSDYLAMAGLTPETDKLLKLYGIDWLIFPCKHPLVRTLSFRPDWRILYRDEQAVVLARTTGKLP